MKIAFYDTKLYDKHWFDKLLPQYGFKIKYIDSKLSEDTLLLAQDCQGVCVFVNDMVTKEIIDGLYGLGIRVLLLRCAGYNQVDFVAAFEKIHVLRVPAYSPYAVAEYACALLLTVNRNTHKAYSRTRDYNFNISGLEGMDLHGKTAGVVGTGQIGRIMIRILQGLGMKVLAYDVFPIKEPDFTYVSLEELLEKSDIISLHCPLSASTYHMINEETIRLMKDDVILINTSRGGLVDTVALIDNLAKGKFRAVGLDVYEEEDEYFFEDKSNVILNDEKLVRLMSFPNVVVTSHQAFLTSEALEKIARTTLDNFKAFLHQEYLVNEVCYRCQKVGECTKTTEKGQCW